MQLINLINKYWTSVLAIAGILAIAFCLFVFMFNLYYIVKTNPVSGSDYHLESFNIATVSNRLTITETFTNAIYEKTK